MATPNTELLLRVRADLNDALAGLGKLGEELRETVERAQQAGASFDDLTLAQRALSAAFGQARTDEARAQIAKLAHEVEEARNAMRGAASATVDYGGAQGAANRLAIEGGRVINDLQFAAMGGGGAFGFLQRAVIATSNQIEGLTLASRAAKAEKVSLAQVLTGSGGLALGLSAAATAVVFLTNAFKDSAREARDAADAYREAFDAAIQVDLPGAQFSIRSLEDAERALEAARGLQDVTRDAETAVRAAFTNPFLSATTNTAGFAEALSSANRESQALDATITGLERTVARFRVTAAVGGALGRAGLSPVSPRAGTTGGGGGRGLAPDRAAVSLYSDVQERVAEWRAEQARLNAALAAYADTQVGATIAAGEYAAAVRTVQGATAPAIETVGQFQLALSEGLRAAGIEGVQAAVYGLSDAFGELAVLNLDGFARGIKQTMLDVVRSVATAIAQALLLRAVLAGLNLVAPGLGTTLGGVLGVATGGGALGGGVAAGVTVNVGGSAVYRNGMIGIPVEVVGAAMRDYERGRRLRGVSS